MNVYITCRSILFVVFCLSGYSGAMEDKNITIPYVPSHLHHMMFELMKVTIMLLLQRLK